MKISDKFITNLKESNTYYSKLIFYFNFISCCAKHGNIELEYLNKNHNTKHVSIYNIIKKIHIKVQQRYSSESINYLDYYANYQLVSKNDNDIPEDVKYEFKTLHEDWILKSPYLLNVILEFYNLYIELGISYCRDLFQYKDTKTLKKFINLHNFNFMYVYNTLMLDDFNNIPFIIKHNARIGGKKAKENYDENLSNRLDYLKSKIDITPTLTNLSRQLRINIEYMDTDIKHYAQYFKNITLFINALVILDYTYCKKNKLNSYKTTLSYLKKRYTNKTELNLKRCFNGILIKKNLGFLIH